MQVRGNLSFYSPFVFCIILVMAGVHDATAGGSLELRCPFIQNKGQHPPEVAYYAAAPGGTVFVTDRTVTYVLEQWSSHERVASEERPWFPPFGNMPTQAKARLTLSERFVTQQALRPVGLEKNEAVVNYLVGPSEEWRTKIPTFKTVGLGELWPGIQVQLRSSSRGIEKIFLVDPKADISQLKVELQGANDLELKEGGLLLDTQLGFLPMSKPFAFQVIEGKQQPVKISYRLEGNVYSFGLESYDGNLPLVIDPLLDSTYLGGDHQSDTPHDIAVNQDEDSPHYGDIYIVGFTRSSQASYPPHTVFSEPGPSGGSKALIAKLSGDLNELEVLTFLGGSAGDIAWSVAIASDGSVFVAGRTGSGDFPVPGQGGFYQDDLIGQRDAYVARLSADLSTVQAATFLGGVEVSGSFERIWSIALDSSDNVFGVGDTTVDFLGSPKQGYAGGDKELYVVKFDRDLTELMASTYVGTDDSEEITDVCWVGDSVYVVGTTASPDFPDDSDSYEYGYEAFVTKLDETDLEIEASRLLSGSALYDGAGSIVGDADLGSVFVVGTTSTTGFHLGNGIYQPCSGSYGVPDAFVARLSLDLTDLIITCLGGTAYESGQHVILEKDNLTPARFPASVIISGTTRFSDFPTTPFAFDQILSGGSDSFIAKMSTDLKSLYAATLIGGSDPSQWEGGSQVALGVGHSGEVYLMQSTKSPPDDGFPATGFQQTLNTPPDVHVARFTADLSADFDRDGIPDLIDVDNIDPLNNTFNDSGTGGTSLGQIDGRGDQTVIVVDEPGSYGFRVIADRWGATGPLTAYGEACEGGSLEYWNLNAGDVFTVTCSSVTLGVLAGQASFRFTALDGRWAETNLGDGIGVHFDEEMFCFTASEDNVVQITLWTADGPLTLDPGDQSTVVEIDFKPGSDSNTVNPSARGVIPVVVPTTDAFDAGTLLSGAIGPNGATEVHGGPHFDDVDGDGDLDAVFHFLIQETGIQCGDTWLVFVGQTPTGTITGSNSIQTVGCK